jgi:hypothetical protein
MNSVSRPRTALSSLGNAVWTASSASVLAGVFLAFRPAMDGQAVLHEVTHPETCRGCASSTPEARAVRDALLIRSGAIEAPIAPASLSGGAGEISRSALTGL